MNLIYGVDPSRPVTVLAVRDAIGECFYQAHCQDAEIGSSEQLSRAYCTSLVQKIFADQGINYDNPTKADLETVAEKLAEFSKNFRSPEIIARHLQEFKTLFSKIE